MKRSLSSMVRAISPFTKSSSKANLKETDTSEFHWNLTTVDVKAALKLFYKQYNPEKALIVGEILGKYVGDEELLLQQLCDRYQLAQDDMQQFLDKAPLQKGGNDSESSSRRGSFRKRQGDDEGSVASESVASNYRTFTWNLSGVDIGEAVALVYRKHNPQKAPNVAALRSRPVEEQLQVLRQLCRRHELTESAMQKFLDQAATPSKDQEEDDDEEEEEETHRLRQAAGRARAVSAASHTNRLPFASPSHSHHSPSASSQSSYLSPPSDEEEHDDRHTAHRAPAPPASAPAMSGGGSRGPPPPRPSQAGPLGAPPPPKGRPSGTAVSFDSSVDHGGSGSGSLGYNARPAPAQSPVAAVNPNPPPVGAPPPHHHQDSSPSSQGHSHNPHSNLRLPPAAPPPAAPAPVVSAPPPQPAPAHQSSGGLAGGQQVFNGQAEAVLLQQAIVAAQRRLMELNDGSETLSERIKESCHRLAEAAAIPLTLAEDHKADREEVNRALAVAEEAQRQAETARLRSESLEKALQTARDQEVALDKALEEERRLHSEAKRALEAIKSTAHFLQSDREDLLQLLTIVGSAKVKAPAQRILAGYLAKVGKGASSEARAVMINPGLPMGDRVDRLLSWRRGTASTSQTSQTQTRRGLAAMNMSMPAADSGGGAGAGGAGGGGSGSGLFDELLADVSRSSSAATRSKKKKKGSNDYDNDEDDNDDDEDDDQAADEDEDDGGEEEGALLPSLLSKAERQLVTQRQQQQTAQQAQAPASKNKKPPSGNSSGMLERAKEREMEAGYLAIKRADSSQRAAASNNEQRLAASLSQQEQRTQQALSASLTRAASPLAIAASPRTTNGTSDKGKDSKGDKGDKEDMARDWVECFDPKSRRKYYYSPSLKSSTWKKPKNMAGQQSQSQSQTTSTTTSPTNDNNGNGSRSSTPDSTRTVNLDQQLIMLGLLGKNASSNSPPPATNPPSADGSSDHDSNSNKDKDNDSSKGYMNHTANSSRASSPAVSVRSNQGLPKQLTSTSVSAGGAGSSDWVAAVDPKSQRKYWYNKVTKVSTWRRPVDVI